MSSIIHKFDIKHKIGDALHIGHNKDDDKHKVEECEEEHGVKKLMHKIKKKMHNKKGHSKKGKHYHGGAYGEGGEEEEEETESEGEEEEEVEECEAEEGGDKDGEGKGATILAFISDIVSELGNI